MSILTAISEMSTVVKTVVALLIFVIILIIHFIRTDNSDSKLNDSELLHDKEFLKKVRESKHMKDDDD